MLSQKNRLRSKESIASLLKSGRVYKSRYFTIRYLETLQPPPHFACLVSRRFDKNASARNHIKRRLTESIRINMPLLNRNIDAVIIPQGAAKQALFQDLKGAIAEFFNHLA